MEIFRPMRGVQLPLSAFFWVVGISIQPDASIVFVCRLPYLSRREDPFLTHAWYSTPACSFREVRTHCLISLLAS
jgi:hypothetical protein